MAHLSGRHLSQRDMVYESKEQFALKIFVFF